MYFYFQCPNGHTLQGEVTDVGCSCDCPTCGATFKVPQPSSDGAVRESFPDLTGTKVAGPAPELDRRPENVHIPCPNGHLLETPREMLNQEAICPYCQVQFRLREKKSVEHQIKREEELERSEMRTGKQWMHWTFVLAALVLFGTILMVLFR